MNVQHYHQEHVNKKAPDNNLNKEPVIYKGFLG